MKNGRTERPGKRRLGIRDAGDPGVNYGGDAIILILCGVYMLMSSKIEGAGLAGFKGGLMEAWCC
jgi:hypothetical protein